MEILVDYNNVLPITRRHGLRFLARRIVEVLGPAVLTGVRNVNIRLYDGWFIERSFTTLAQQIAAEIQSDFPLVVTLPSLPDPLRLVVSMQMATSLACDPANDLLRTYRPRVGQKNLTCRDPASAGCVAPTCALTPLRAFLDSQLCPAPGCTIVPDQLLVRGEQKLVDAMILVDLLHSHLSGGPPAVVVSSDDDLWPVLRLLLARGHRVFHIHTHTSRRTPPIYLNRVSVQFYTQLNL